MTDISPTVLPPDSLALSGVLQDFASRGYFLPASATYPAMWRAVVNGRLPAQQVNGTGRYRVSRADLPAYAAYLGVTAPAPAPAKPARKAPAAPASIAA